MNFKPLGAAAKVSEIGMGTYYDPQWVATAKTIGWKRGAGSKVEALKAGLDGGMNFIDTAEIYGSEPLVARAIKGRKREDLFIATKAWPNHLRRDALVRSLERSLRVLETPYVDLYQAHFPNTKVPIAETMAAMEELKDKGMLLSIGVSNFSLQQTIDANAALKKSQLASNQVECSLAHREIEADLLPYCESNKISIISYYPLGHGKLTTASRGSKMEEICKAYSKTPAQVALNWLASGRNVFAIPRASRAEHVKENLGASGWELKAEDRAQLEGAFPR
jgi:diketogulonate reductase-like aldo/keto reductase